MAITKREPKHFLLYSQECTMKHTEARARSPYNINGRWALRKYCILLDSCSDIIYKEQDAKKLTIMLIAKRNLKVFPQLSLGQVFFFFGCTIQELFYIYFWGIFYSKT